MIKIALAGNPNCGKTTLFNSLTGSNQFVGNWPGVTVEKKEGRLKDHKDVIITDLPGIYSLSPYTPEEIVARDYLTVEKPDVILNIVDGTNLERNLYLTTQLAELGIPIVIAINMIDVVNKNGDKIDINMLSKKLGCKIVKISALKGIGIQEVTECAINLTKHKSNVNVHKFSKSVENALTQISEIALGDITENAKRWYAIKLFERDDKAISNLVLFDSVKKSIESEIKAVEEELEDDSESIITNERYDIVCEILKGSYKKKNAGGLSASDKIDRIVTNRFLGIPIFAIVMFLVYYVSMVTVGTTATDWANDGLFGDGWYLLGIGNSAYEEAVEEYGHAENVINAFLQVDEGKETEKLSKAEIVSLLQKVDKDSTVGYIETDEETMYSEEVVYNFNDLTDAATTYEKYDYNEPKPKEYGIWVPGIPTVLGDLLESLDCAEWLEGLILDGIVAGVGAVLGFVPQMFVLFLMLAFLEACGYMSRIAFVMDRVFRRFGLSGKSFIPILVGTGCGVPGIMASRTIENEYDRRMTIMTTTFIPCGAKTPFIAMIAGAVFGGSPWVAVSAYFLGMAAIICSGIILKKTRLFEGDVSPFVMELPAYHMPTASNVLRSMFERGWSFIKKAGTIILISTVFIWCVTYFGFVDGKIAMLSEGQMDKSILAVLGKSICWIFAPLGWGNWQSTVASVTGLIAKENIVGTMGILYGGSETYKNLQTAFTTVSGYSFLTFNLLCAPCFAAIGAIRREMNSAKWTWFAIVYQCGFAYITAFCINQIGCLLSGTRNIIGIILSTAIIMLFMYMLVRPHTIKERRIEYVK